MDIIIMMLEDYDYMKWFLSETVLLLFISARGENRRFSYARLIRDLMPLA